MRDRVRPAPRRLLLPVLLLLVSCGGRSTLDRSTREGEEPTGERTSSSASSITLHGSRAEAQLVSAKTHAREGRFDEAVREFRALYQDQGNPEPVRAQALLRWAEAEASLLNPRRDLDAAIGHLELFRDRFPKSPFLPDAQAALERLRAQRDSGAAPSGDAGEGPAN